MAPCAAIAATIMLLSAAPAVCSAQTNNPAPSALQLFNQGMQQYQNRNYGAAADLFARSFKVHAYPVTALYVASATSYLKGNPSRTVLQNAQTVMWYLDCIADLQTKPGLDQAQQQMAAQLRAWAKRIIDANRVAQSHSSSNAGTASALDADEVEEPAPKPKAKK